MPEAVTFRAELKRAVSDLLADAGMQCTDTEEALLALIVQLADYREEGASLYPRLVICDGLSNALPILGGSGPVALGRGPRGVETMRICLKKCAPLAQGGWSIWVERTDGDFIYGVFREPLVPVAIDLRVTVTSLGKGDVSAILVCQVAQSTVELLSPGIDPVLIHMSGSRKEQVTSGHDEERRLAEWCAEGIEDDRLKESVLSFANTVLHDLLRHCHGTLIAVVDAAKPVPTSLTSDAIVLSEPDDLAAMVDRQSRDRTSEALDELLCHRNLLGGMLQSDGAVILDTRGRLMAFNCFVQTDTSGLSPSELMGGARRRAFGFLCSLVDSKELRGAFIRSSDGHSHAHGGGQVD